MTLRSCVCDPKSRPDAHRYAYADDLAVLGMLKPGSAPAGVKTLSSDEIDNLGNLFERKGGHLYRISVSTGPREESSGEQLCVEVSSARKDRLFPVCGSGLNRSQLLWEAAVQQGVPDTVLALPHASFSGFDTHALRGDDHDGSFDQLPVVVHTGPHTDDNGKAWFAELGHHRVPRLGTCEAEEWGVDTETMFSLQKPHATKLRRALREYFSKTVFGAWWPAVDSPKAPQRVFMCFLGTVTDVVARLTASAASEGTVLTNTHVVMLDAGDPLGPRSMSVDEARGIIAHTVAKYKKLIRYTACMPVEES